jgi:protein-tyrosine kinase
VTNLMVKNREINSATMPKKNQSIGGILLDSGKITPADAERILHIQKEKCLRFGDAAKFLGLITEEDIQQVLAQQFDFPILSGGDGEFSPELIASYQSTGEQVQALRAVRSQLMLRWFNESRKVLSVASSGRGEGRSYLTANLAIVFSQLGERTLLIDADLWQSRQHQLFKLDQTQGLSDLLTGRIDESVIARIPAFRNLSVLPSGTKPPNPMELISRGMTTCLNQFSQHYDVILIDTPASEQGPDSQLLASKAGGAILLARQNKSRLVDLEKLKYLFESAGAVCVGAVVGDF